MTGHWQKSVIAFALALVLLLTGCGVFQSGGGAANRSTRLPRIVQTDMQKRANIGLQLAINYYEQNQFLVAVEEASLVLDMVPDLADAYSVRALAYMALGQSSQAESDFRHALKLEPDNPDFANNYGWFLCNDAEGRRVVAASRYFSDAFDNHAYGSPSKALTNAGICSLKAGDTNAAETYFTRALQHAPTSAVINVNLGQLYFDRHEFEKARFHLDLAGKKNTLKANELWLAIRVERKLGNQAAEYDLATQLRRRYSSSPEYAAYQRGVIDE